MVKLLSIYINVSSYDDDVLNLIDKLVTNKSQRLSQVHLIQ